MSFRVGAKICLLLSGATEIGPLSCWSFTTTKISQVLPNFVVVYQHSLVLETCHLRVLKFIESIKASQSKVLRKATFNTANEVSGNITQSYKTSIAQFTLFTLLCCRPTMGQVTTVANWVLFYSAAHWCVSWYLVHVTSTLRKHYHAVQINLFLTMWYLSNQFTRHILFFSYCVRNFPDQGSISQRA